MSERRKCLILIFLATILIGIVEYQMVVWHTGGVFFFPGDDPYITLRYTKKIIEGHPFKVNPEDPFPAPLEPSILAQFLYASGFYLGFKSPEALSSFVYWLNILLLSFSLIILFLFLMDGLNLSCFNAFLGVIFCLLYNPFRYLFTFDMGWGIFTFLFYLMIYFTFVKKEKFYFIIPAIFLSLTRPEAIYILLFFLLFYFLEKNIKKVFWMLLPIFTNFLPIFMFNLLFKTSFPTGFKPQFLLTHYSIGITFSSIFKYMIDYLKGIFLSSYPFTAFGYNYIEYNFSPFPPLFFIFIILGIWEMYNKEEYNKKICLFFLILFIFALIISSFTLYQGVHLLRHTAWLLPFFILTGVKGIFYLGKKINLVKFLIGVYFLIFIASSVDFLIYTSLSSIRNTLPHWEAAKWIDKNLKKPNLIGIVNSRLDFFLKNKAKFYNLTPGDNWRISKYAHDLNNLAYAFELLTYEFEKNEEDWFLVWSKEDETTVSFPHFSALAGDTIYKKYYLFDNYFKIAKIKKFPFLNAKKVYALSNFKILDEVNPGDPLSEREHNYKYFLNLPYMRVKIYPFFGKLKNPQSNEKEYIIEGVSFAQYERFNLSLQNLEKDTLFLIGRFASEGYCAVIEYLRGYLYPIKLSEQKITIYINRKKLDSFILSEVQNFSEYIFRIPKGFLKVGENRVEVEGLHLSCRWFIGHK